MQWTIDSLIFMGFLLVNLVVGLLYGRRVKTIKDYALGGRNFSTAALVSTIVATTVTGSGFFVDLSNTYSDGLPYIIASLGMSLQFFMIALLIPKMGEFMGALSIAEVMGNLYGNKVRLITAVSGILASVGIIAVQFKVFGSLVIYFVGVSPKFGIIIAAAIVILYSAFGGIRAVTYTDVLQFFTFGCVIPVVGIIVWNQFTELNISLTTALQNPVFSYHKILDMSFKEFISFIFLILYFAFPIIAPVDFQRISMGKNVQQVQRAFMISMVLFIFISLAVMWIPFLIANINPSLQPDEITSYMINNYTYPGFKGLIIIGVAAMAMSSADSYINGSAVLFAYDLKEVLNVKIGNLILSKIFALMLGIFAIYLATSTNDLLGMVMSSSALYMPIVGLPLFIATLGFRSSTKSVMIGMSAGFAVVVATFIFDIDFDSNITGIIANTLFLFGSHYLLKQPGGWVKTQKKNYKKTKRQQIARLISNFRPQVLLDFCKKTAPKDEMMYTWLGVYFIFFTISTMYSTQVGPLQGTNKVLLIIYQFMMCTGVVTAMYPIWPARIKREIIMQIAWNIVIFYMLVFFSCFFIMLSEFNQLQFVIFTINILITALLVGWKLSLTMMIVGFYLSVGFYKYYAGIDHLNISLGSPQFIFMYALTLIGSFLVIFLKPKQEQEALMESKNKHLSSRIGSQEKQVQEALAVKKEFIRNMTHEYNTPMTNIVSLAQSLWQSYDKMDDKQVKESLEMIFKSAKRLQNFDDNLSSLSKFSQDSCKLDLELMSLSDLVEERVKICRKFYDEDQQRNFHINIEDNILINGDKYYLTQIVDNLIINAITYCPSGRISITLLQNEDIAHFSIMDSGIGIPADEIHDIFTEFSASSKTRTNNTGRGVGLALCKKVIENHHGKIYAESNGVEGACFTFTLPLHSENGKVEG